MKPSPLVTAAIMDVPDVLQSTGKPELMLDFVDLFKRHDKRRKDEQEQDAHVTLAVSPLSIATI